MPKNICEEALEKLAEEALGQIGDKRYESEMRYVGVERILKLGKS